MIRHTLRLLAAVLALAVGSALLPSAVPPPTPVAADVVAVDAPAVLLDLAPAGFWCASRRPHSGDALAGPDYNYWYVMAQGVVTARCRAWHSHGGQVVNHWYYVTVWDQDGDNHVERVTWTPLGPGWT